MLENCNVGFQRRFFISKQLDLLCDMSFTNRTTLRLSTGNPLYHFPITPYSIIPLFQYSNCERSERACECLEKHR
jgi:hypothetical protein